MNDPAEEIKEILTRSAKKIAVAESLTAGHLQSLIASVSGSSDYFEGGVTAYNIDRKEQLLGVNRAHAESVNSVSEQVAREMAAGVRNLFHADVGIATTGYAQPSEEDEVDQPFAYFAVDDAGRIMTGRVDAADLDRVEVQTHVAETVLRRVVDFLGAR